MIELDKLSDFLLLGLAPAVEALGAVFGLLSWLDQRESVPTDDLGRNVSSRFGEAALSHDVDK